jgi:hypothetical protein
VLGHFASRAVKSCSAHTFGDCVQRIITIITIIITNNALFSICILITGPLVLHSCPSASPLPWVARTLAAVFYKISTGVAALQPLLMLMLMLLMLPHRALLVGDELSLRSGCCDMLHARARTAGIGASCRRRSCEAGNDSKYGHLSRVTCDV